MAEPLSKSLTICVHCYCPRGYDTYAQHLKWELASLLLSPPSVPVTVVVCRASAGHDYTTTRVLADFMRETEAARRMAGVTINSLVLPPEELLRRGVGRNTVAKSCETDVCWFADADYVFEDGSVEAVVRQVSPDSELCYPDEVQVNVDHATGDRMVAENLDVTLPRIDPSLFTPLRRRLAIGGLQIVGGNVARERGYLDGTKWVKPVAVDRGWRATKEDKAFRKGRAAVPIKVPNLYWIRHAVKGQDLDIAGRLVGREAW